MSSDSVQVQFKKLESTFKNLEKIQYADFLQQCKLTEKQVRDLLKSTTFRGPKKLKIELLLNHV